MKFKRAFTLAEVLITLVIIGVVAAITLPALRSDVDKTAFATGLKTNISILNNGFRQIMVNDDTDDMRNTTLWIDYLRPIAGTPDITTDMKVEMSKFFKIDKVELAQDSSKKFYGFDNTERTFPAAAVRFYLSNSAILMMTFLEDNGRTACTTEQSYCNPVASIILDVNGDKGPNTIGKDIYYLDLGEDGFVYPYGSKAVHEFREGVPEWDTEEGCQGENPSVSGESCAGRVVDEGFKINYF